jgi:hypothetical protein
VRLNRCEILKSPREDDMVRLIGEVTYDHGFLKSDRIWFEVAEDYAGFLTDLGNPWLACLIPLAVTLGEPLCISRPVDRQLFDNVQELMRIWKGWFPHLHIVPVEAEIIEGGFHNSSGKTAMFFSGGVDSFHTLLRYDAEAGAGSHQAIDDLLFLWGFDIPIWNNVAFEKVANDVHHVAAELGKDVVIVASNMRQTRFQQTTFKDHSHGSFLAAAGLVLEKRYKKLIISNSDTGEYHGPWGSHQFADPLYSTTNTRIRHFGVEYDRIEKTTYVAQSRLAMEYLRVCWLSNSGGNCGNCEKCIRTRLTLELLGALERCSTFKTKQIDLDQIAHLYSSDEWSLFYLRPIYDFARSQGRDDIADALERSFVHTDRLNRWLLLSLVWKTKAFLQKRTALWSMLHPIRIAIKSIMRVVTVGGFK